MHRIASHTRILALVIPAALAAALLALVLLGGGTGGTHTLATGPTPAPSPALTGVSCADVYVDLNNNGLADDLQSPPNGIGDDDITSLTMSRTEPSVAHPGQWDVTTVQYLGKAPVGGLVPGGPPGPSCASTTTAAATSAEANVFSGAFQVPYANQYGMRPTALGTYTDNGDGTGHLDFSTCVYSEAQTTWVRIDSRTEITKTGPGSQNEGVGTLYLGTSAPVSGGIDTNGQGVINATTDPLTCDPNGPDHTPGGTDDAAAYHFVFTAYGQTATTDHTAAAAASGTSTAVGSGTPGTLTDGGATWTVNQFAGFTVASGGKMMVIASNTGQVLTGMTAWVGGAPATGAYTINNCGTDTACQRNVTLGIAQDVDGPHPKTKSVDQVPDSADGLADDWDGDGCPNWDELGRGFMAQAGGTPPLHYPPAYTWSTDPVNGMDPFNPNDCDHNFASNISLSTTIIAPPVNGHNTGGATSGNPAIGCTFLQILTDTCGISNGQYFHCLADVTDGKAASPNPLTFRLGCYSDSTVTVINSSYPRAGMASTCPPAPADMCGDGKSDVPPPGCRSAPTEPTPVPACARSLPVAGTDTTVLDHCDAALVSGTVKIYCHPDRWVYTAITAAEYPVLAVGDATHNYYDAAANQIHIGGCFPGLGGVAFGPNVYGAGLIDAHTGVGSFKLWIGRADCSVPLETDAHILGTVSIVELQSKKGVTAADLGTPVPCIPNGVCSLYDSDGDGCPDSLELQGPAQLANAQRNGGLRDPYNKWDFFDPAKSPNVRKHNSSDITAVVQAFAKNEWKDNGAGGVMLDTRYNPAFDRTGIQGSNNWDLGPPNGFETSADILAAVKSYDNNCPHTP